MRYDSYKTSCDSVPGACGSGAKHQRKIKLVEEFENDQTDMTYKAVIGVLTILLIISLFLNFRKPNNLKNFKPRVN